MIKLSLVIPTKNRQFYCLEAIKQIEHFGFKDVEICIQDNSDKDSLRFLINELNYDNIIYNYHYGLLSFVDNFSEAVSLARGEWICLLGDDDGILPNIVEVIEFAEKNGYDAVIPGGTPSYYWPSDLSLKEDARKGCIVWYPISDSARIGNPNEELKSLLQDGGQNYLDRIIPRLYHGLVRKERVEQVKTIAGAYFLGLTPDIFMATSLCFVCKSVARLSYPFTIAGICPNSGSSNSQTGKHVGRYEDAPHLLGHTNYNWSSFIPMFYSVDTIWAETMIQAISVMTKDSMLRMFNTPLFDCICLRKYPDFSKTIRIHQMKFGISNFAMNKQFVFWKCRCFFKKIINKLNRKINGVDGVYHEYGYTDIHSATVFLSAIINKLKY
jgi:glycosyltransferase involved in cell wall biosynthesis